MQNKPTIVCVDDDTLVLRSLREQLRRGLGTFCEIELVESSVEALQLLDDLVAEGVDVPLLICDHIMPGMRGAQLMAQVHQRFPAMVKIMLTGQADSEAIGLAVNQANLYRILSKPWQEHDLVMTVREALHKVEQDRKVQQYASAMTLANRQLEQSVELLHATMDATLDGILVIDQGGRIVQYNRQFLALWPTAPKTAIGEPSLAMAAYLKQQLCNPNKLVVDGTTSVAPNALLELIDERLIEYSSHHHCLRDTKIGMVYSFRDVTERERSAAVIHRQARYDTVTNLANRYQFDEALEREVERAAVLVTSLAVMFIDLDRFKCINDTFGHAVGDELLRCVAQRLRQCVRDCDLVARWGGDEFTILLPLLKHSDEAATVAQRILDALSSPLQVNTYSLQISVSIGIAVFPDEAKNAASLLKHADEALYSVKDSGRNGYQRYRPP